MCKLGNQTIFRVCRDHILKQTGKGKLSNQEARVVLAKNGGCMVRDAHQEQH